MSNFKISFFFERDAGSTEVVTNVVLAVGISVVNGWFKEVLPCICIGTIFALLSTSFTYFRIIAICKLTAPVFSNVFNTPWKCLHLNKVVVIICYGTFWLSFEKSSEIFTVIKSNPWPYLKFTYFLSLDIVPSYRLVLCFLNEWVHFPALDIFAAFYIVETTSCPFSWNYRRLQNTPI